MCTITSLSASAFLKASQSNLIYGMDHGAALLMDVYQPETPNGLGVLFIMGTGFTAYGEYDDVPLKHLDTTLLENGVFDNFMGQKRQVFAPLVEAGFTVFSINHRLAPKYTWQTQVRDCQRAVQYIRFRAKDFGIDPDRLGGMGHSSGGSMITFVAVLDDVAAPDAFDPINRESSRLQAIVPISGMYDALQMLDERPESIGMLAGAVGPRITYQPPGHPVFQQYREFAPANYVTADDPAMLLIHGAADPVVDIKQAETLANALEKAGVTYKLIILEGADHGGLTQPIDFEPMSRATLWMETQLRK